MYEISQKTLDWAYIPFDIVELKDGGIGLINLVSVNACQDKPQEQIHYSILFIKKGPINSHSAWYKQSELVRIGNLITIISKSWENTYGKSSYVERLLGDKFKTNL